MSDVPVEEKMADMLRDMMEETEVEEAPNQNPTEILEAMEVGMSVFVSGGLNPLVVRKVEGGYAVQMATQVVVTLATSTDPHAVIEMVSMLSQGNGCGCGSGSCDSGGCEA